MSESEEGFRSSEQQRGTLLSAPQYIQQETPATILSRESPNVLGTSRQESPDAIRILDDLRNIGPDKPLGYLPISTINKYLKSDMQNLIREAEEKGLFVKIFRDGEVPITGGALFMADVTALDQLIKLHERTLKAFGWPIEPKEFLEYVATRHAPNKTKLFDVVADAFADYINTGRTDVVGDIAAEAEHKTIGGLLPLEQRLQASMQLMRYRVGLLLGKIARTVKAR
jgi:hypothetical protein